MKTEWVGKFRELFDNKDKYHEPVTCPECEKIDGGVSYFESLGDLERNISWIIIEWDSTLKTTQIKTR